MSAPILNSTLPAMPWMAPASARLPGLQPIGDGPWLMQTDRFAAQMALRDALIGSRAAEVHAVLPLAEAAASECLDMVLETLAGAEGYEILADRVTRPDGESIALDRDRPLLTAGRLVQEDLCLMIEGEAGEHVLGGAILCFPAGWTLSEKIGRPLTAIHVPIVEYDDNLARRVQRLFDAIHVDRPMWRGNALRYDDPALFAPRREADLRDYKSPEARYLRTERQTLRRLPVTRAVVFSILTSVIEIAALPEDARAALP